MAKVIDQHLGSLRGKMGPQVFKMHGNDAFATRLPHRIIVPPSVDTINRRMRFRHTVKMANKIQSIPQLKYFWKNFVIQDEVKKLSATNKIVKSIYPKMRATGPLDTLAIVPDTGFKVTPVVTLTNTQFSAVIQPIGASTIIDTNVEVRAYMVCVAYLFAPVDTDNTIMSRFVWLVSESIALSLINPMTFDIELGDYYSQIYDEYASKKVFFALVTVDINDVPVHFSNTFLEI